MTAASIERICRTCGLRSVAPEGQFCPQDGRALLDPEVLARHAAHPLLGRVLGGKYAVVDLIGLGGFSAVYRAIQAPVGREVAVKVLRSPPSHPESNLEARFFREARAIARLQCESTVHLYDFGLDEVRYMVLEYVRGKLLCRLLHEEKRLLPERAVAIALQILEALAEAHAHGVIHRDLKPENVIVFDAEPDGHERVKVLDFGIAKLTAEAPGAWSSLGGLVIGTPQYMAPEQAEGHAVPASDLYAVGVMLYQMLTGRLPFEGRHPLEVLQAQKWARVPPFDPELGLPDALQAAVMAALEKNPEARPPSATAMASMLRAASLPVAAASQPVLVALVPTAPLAPEPSRRRWTGLAVIAGLVVLLGVLRVSRSEHDPVAEAAVVPAVGPAVVSAAAPPSAPPSVKVVRVEAPPSSAASAPGTAPPARRVSPRRAPVAVLAPAETPRPAQAGPPVDPLDVFQ